MLGLLCVLQDWPRRNVLSGLTDVCANRRLPLLHREAPCPQLFRWTSRLRLLPEMGGRRRKQQPEPLECFARLWLDPRQLYQGLIQHARGRPVPTQRLGTNGGSVRVGGGGLLRLLGSGAVHLEAVWALPDHVELGLACESIQGENHSRSLRVCGSAGLLIRVCFQIIGNLRIKNVGKYQSCMVSKLPIIWKQTVRILTFVSCIPFILLISRCHSTQYCDDRIYSFRVHAVCIHAL